MTQPTIVVARYNEDITWLQNITHPSIVYNKSTEPYDVIVNHTNITIIDDVANVGREAYPYLKFIIDNYDHLPDITVFLQGCIKDHQAGFDTPGEFIDVLISEAAAKGMSMRTVHDCYDTKPDFTIDFWYTAIEASPIRPFDQWFKKYIGEQLQTNPLQWIPAACFAVRKDHILQHTRAFYMRLLHTVDHHVNPEAVYFLERSWYHIFK
jgi:hypothetical protein